MERLQKIIAESGFASRRKAEEYIKAGKVYVNGVIANLGDKASYEDEIMVDGKYLDTKQDKVYYLLYKPEGVITSASDDHGRKTVVDIINSDKRIYPVGRLDYDTSGALILTNDGELTNILEHPSHEITKTYVAKINGVLTPEEFMTLKKGIVIDGRRVPTKYVKVKEIFKDNTSSNVIVSISEGRNHIVKKMFGHVNHKVLKLKRIAIADIDLTGLHKGEYRQLTIKEVKSLYALK